MALNKELQTALEICQNVGEVQVAKRREISSISLKDDLSPVTEVDLLCEQMIMQRLEKDFPADSILGEENGMLDKGGDRKWIIDPLDGTRPYIKGIPTYSVLLALEREGAVALGVIFLPELQILCWAVQGEGAFINGDRIHVSATDQLSQATGSSLGYVEYADKAEGQQLLRLQKAWDYTYGFMDAFTYVCVARGSLDVCVSFLDKPWDCAPASCIIAEAGGVCSDLYGTGSIYNGSCVVSNGVLHPEILHYFKNNEETS